MRCCLMEIMSISSNSYWTLCRSRCKTRRPKRSSTQLCKCSRKSPRQTARRSRRSIIHHPMCSLLWSQSLISLRAPTRMLKAIHSARPSARCLMRSSMVLVLESVSTHISSRFWEVSARWVSQKRPCGPSQAQSLSLLPIWSPATTCRSTYRWCSLRCPRISLFTLMLISLETVSLSMAADRKWIEGLKNSTICIMGTTIAPEGVAERVQLLRMESALTRGKPVSAWYRDGEEGWVAAVRRII